MLFLFTFRLVVMFFLSLVSVIIVASLTNHTLSVLLATAFGFLLSHDIFLNTKAILTILIFPCKLGFNLRRNLFTKTFVSYSAIDFHTVNDYKSYLTHFMVSVFKGTVFLAVGLTVVYFMFTLNNSEELVTSILAGCVIGLYMLLKISDNLQSVYIFKLFRNPLFPNQCENTSKFKKRRNWLRYFSLPRRLFVTYCKCHNKTMHAQCMFLVIMQSFFLSYSVSSTVSGLCWCWIGNYINKRTTHLVWDCCSKNTEEGVSCYIHSHISVSILYACRSGKTPLQLTLI